MRWPRLADRLCLGRLQRYARSGFKRSPTEHLDATLRQLLL
jgi:TetR/AcrR family transcriptional regulator